MVKLVTFTSDFGTHDSYVAEVKGVIGACDPDIKVIDITHWIEPGNLDSGAFVIFSSFMFFRAGTVHLAVVDPGVGSKRDIIVVVTREYVFIGPDNGVLYEAVQRAGGGSVFGLDRERFLKRIEKLYSGNRVIDGIIRRGVSSTFHGRDLFAPLTAYLCSKEPVEEVAQKKGSMEKLSISSPLLKKDRVIGKIIYIDRFGNLITNVEESLVSASDEVFLKTSRSMTSVGRMKHSYASTDEGSPLSLIGSRGYLEIAINRGSAREYFKARIGDEIFILRKQAKNNDRHQKTAR